MGWHATWLCCSPMHSDSDLLLSLWEKTPDEVQVRTYDADQKAR